MNTKSQKTILIIAAVILVLGGLYSSGIFGNNFSFLDKYFRFPKLSPVSGPPSSQAGGTIKITNEESVVINAVESVSPAVVTVGISQSAGSQNMMLFDPFDPFAPFRQQPNQPNTQKIEQDIGSGFIVDKSGLIVTNKHVVSDTQATYKVITKDDKSYDVVKIYRDPANDLAILKVNFPGNDNNIAVVKMGDSTKIKVGQLAIAIGTALGQFRNTVTTGVISGIGRGITAGSPFEGYAERLDNVIQTDAAINPGNSGGPLLNSSGEVIGVNAAVSSEGQNIGFALPINVIKDALVNFNQTGQFDRPYIGVRYKVITKDVALMNEVPEGAYIMEVIDNSPAQNAGIEQGDIIIKIDSTRLTGTNSELSKFISSKKVGDRISVTVWRNGKEVNINLTLGNQSQ